MILGGDVNLCSHISRGGEERQVHASPHTDGLVERVWHASDPLEMYLRTLNVP